MSRRYLNGYMDGARTYIEEGPGRARFAAAGGTNLAVDVSLPSETTGAGPVERRYVAPQTVQDAPRAAERAA